MNWHLTIESGPGRGMAWSLDAIPLVIGRGRNCEIAVPDPSVSRKHCRITESNGKVMIEDLDSSNSVIVNGTPVDKRQLELGDRIAIGMTVLRVAVLSPGPAGIDTALASKETASLSADDPIFSESMAPTISCVQPRTVEDLAMLFQLGRKLSNLDSFYEQVAETFNVVDSRLCPDSKWLVCTDEIHEWQRIHLDSSRYSAFHESLVKMAVAERRGIVTARRVPPGGLRDIRTILACPAAVAGKVPLVIVAEAISKNRVYDESDLALLMSIAQVAAPYFQLSERVETLKERIEELEEYCGKGHRLLGSSPAIESVRSVIRRIAPSKLSVLLLGETGTGKELAAVMLHELSDRATHPFVAINCASIPSELFESEMFGYEPGAFSGASRTKIGQIEKAHRGTLFLDEIGDLSPTNQARILRALETGSFNRVGGVKPIRVDVRIVSATNRDLQAAVTESTFRSDLYHRIRGIEVQMPSLCARSSDIGILAQHFLQIFASDGKLPHRGFTVGAIEYLKSLPWPGNVRELRMCIHRAVFLSKSEWIDVQDLLPQLPARPYPSSDKAILTIRELERSHIAHVLRQCDGNISAAAKCLDIHRNTLYAKIQEYRL